MGHSLTPAVVSGRMPPQVALQSVTADPMLCDRRFQVVEYLTSQPLQVSAGELHVCIYEHSVTSLASPLQTILEFVNTRSPMDSVL